MKKTYPEYLQVIMMPTCWLLLLLYQQQGIKAFGISVSQLSTPENPQGGIRSLNNTYSPSQRTRCRSGRKPRERITNSEMPKSSAIMCQFGLVSMEADVSHYHLLAKHRAAYRRQNEACTEIGKDETRKLRCRGGSACNAFLVLIYVIK